MPLGKNIRRIREERGLSQEALSELIRKVTGNKVSQGAISALEKRDSESSQFAPDIARALDVSVEELLTGKPPQLRIESKRRDAPQVIDLDEHPEYSAIRRVRFKLSAGVSGYEVEYLNGHRAPIFFRRDWLDARSLAPDQLMAVEVMGQSMETSLYAGDVVVVNVADTVPRDGEVFAVNYDGELVIKRMVKNAGEWFLSSDNPDKRRFPDKLCDERTIIVGRIVHKQSERI